MHDLTRGDFLKGGAGTAAALLLPQTRLRGVPRVAVIGAGNAGMTAAYRIHRRTGWPVTVYEASERIGGRTWTNKTFMAGNQWFEHGGGGVNTNQLQQPFGIGALVRELGMGPMYDLWLHYPDGGNEYYFNGRFGLDREAYQAAVKVATEQFARSAWPFTYVRQNAENRRLDDMSAAEWIERYVPGGLRGSAGADLANAKMGGEYGARAADISAFALVADLGGTFWGYAGRTYDERWGIPGGNDNLSKTLATRLPPGSVRFGHALRGIAVNGDGSVALEFERANRYVSVTADRVVVAIPTGGMLGVDYRRANFSRVKIASFAEPNGENCKLTFQFADQVWAANNRSSDAQTDLLVYESWQGSYIGSDGRYGGTPFAPPVWVAFNVVPYPQMPAHGPAPAGLVQRYLAVADVLFPSPKASSRFIAGKAWLDNWPLDPFSHGSYSFYRPGQWQRFGGAEALPEGNVFFAGEHTAPYPERGYMNGAVLSGERAAREVLASL